MAKTESTFLNMLVVLTVTTLIVGAALGYVYNITKKPIAEAEQKQQIEAIQMVAPEFDNSPIKDKYSLKIGADSLEVTVFPAKKGGQKVGAAVEAITKKGFGGNEYGVQDSEKNGMPSVFRYPCSNGKSKQNAAGRREDHSPGDRTSGF